MLKLDAYKFRDLQNFLSLLTQAEAGGVTDVRFLREQLQRHIDSVRKEVKVYAVTAKRAVPEAKTCPSPDCSGGILVGPYKVKDAEGDMLIVRCSQKCGYSEVIR